MNLGRRSLLAGFAGLLVAPSIVRAASLMRVKPHVSPPADYWGILNPDAEAELRELTGFQEVKTYAGDPLKEIEEIGWKEWHSAKVLNAAWVRSLVATSHRLSWNGGDCVGQKDADETEEGRPGLLTVGSGGLVNTTAAGF